MQSKGAWLITAERKRQIEVEGWTPEHDAQHKNGELTMAAVAYAAGDETYWPWATAALKPKNRVNDLVRAGALIAAEIDRLLASSRTGVVLTMTDRERAIAALEAGVTPQWYRGGHYLPVKRQGKRLQVIDTGWSFDSPINAMAAAADALGLTPEPQSTPLTLEMVEKVRDAVLAEMAATETLQQDGLDIARYAAQRIVILLRQQMGGNDRG